MDDLDDSFASEDIYYGFINAHIVGIRYYSGMVSNREMVSLQREPNNPFDCNAVRVNNVMGDQVGHIKRETACALAVIMDQRLARIEGLVPRGSGNVYSIPIILSFWGDEEKQSSVKLILHKSGYILQTGLPVKLPQKGGASSSSLYFQPSVKSVVISQSQVKSQLDSLFENLKAIDHTSEVEQAQVISTKLFCHQRQALCWMIRKEHGNKLPPFWEETKHKDGRIVFKNTITNFHTVTPPGKVRGGILADDMGLGKTLVAIALIVSNSCENKQLFEAIQTNLSDSERSQESLYAKVSNISPTYVRNAEVKDSNQGFKVVSQNQKTENTATKNAKVCSKRAIKRPARYDDKVVNYTVSNMVTNKEKKQKLSKKSIQKSNLGYCKTQDSMLGPPSQPANHVSTLFVKGLSKPTLIICPLSVISNWEDQIKEHLQPNASLNTIVYHGAMRSSCEKHHLAQQDVVITTYQTLAHEFKRCKKQGHLQSTDWLRVILDEGHVIRNPSALQTLACCNIKSERKWILSGTPIQNSIKDLWPIVSFLGLEPFTERSWWQRTIERPLRSCESAALTRIQCLMGSICMRRTKKQKINGKPIVNLPSREVVLQKLDMCAEDRLIYNRMDALTKRTIQTMLDDGNIMTKYAEVLVILMRLRQICCHSYLAKDAIDQLEKGYSVPATEAKELVAKLVMLLASGSAEECCVCLGSLNLPVITRCAHIFCKTCISEVICSSSRDVGRCPLCRREVKETEITEVPPEVDEREVLTDEAMKPSTKVNALMFELLRIRREEPQVKSLVVSQFTSFLCIIEKHLQSKGVPCILFHGALNSAKRKEALKVFKNGSIPVMLLSLKAGGVGLNLTTASRVFLMEPAWNPAAEEQCFDRVHRLGQTKQVKIIKFICSQSIEERIIEIQDTKRDLAHKSMNGKELQKKRIDELRILAAI